MRFLLPSLFVAFAIGCGGSTEAPVTTDNDSSTADETSTSDTSVTPGSDSTPGDDSTTPGEDSTTPGSDSTTGSETGGGDGTTINCGKTTCNAKTQVCCATVTMMGFTEACVDTGKCTGMGSIPIACTDPSVCPSGDVCCAHFGGGGGMTGASCQATCTTGTKLCATDADCSMGQKCVTSMTTGFKRCSSGGGGFDAGSFDSGFKFDGGTKFDTGPG